MIVCKTQTVLFLKKPTMQKKQQKFPLQKYLFSFWFFLGFSFFIIIFFLILTSFKPIPWLCRPCWMVLGHIQSKVLETLWEWSHVYLKIQGQLLLKWFRCATCPHLCSSGFIHQVIFVLGTTEMLLQQKPFLVLSLAFMGSWRVTAKPRGDHFSQLTNCWRGWSGRARRTSHSWVVRLQKRFQQSCQSTDEEEARADAEPLHERWGDPPCPQPAAWPNLVLGAAKPLEGNMDPGSCEKGQLCVISQHFIPQLNQMKHGKRCVKMENNREELLPLQASKAGIAVKSGFVEVQAGSSEGFHPCTLELHIHYCNRSRECGSHTRRHGLSPHQACSSDNK